jgi:hypothetical protein
MTTIDIATELYSELGEPSDATIPEITYWLKSNFGRLNNLIHTSYSSVTTGEITPELGDDAKVIFKDLYFIKYYALMAKNNLGAASINVALEVTSDGSSVKMANRNEISKTYLQLKKQYEDEVKDLITGFNSNASPPVQVVGEDYLAVEPIHKYNRTEVD